MMINRGSNINPPHISDVRMQWNSGFRGLLNQLSENDLQRFRKEDLSQIESHISEQGFFLRVETLFGVGIANVTPPCSRRN